jgi:hypothetical protein
MNEESQFVADEEFVLRRIHKNQVDPGPPPVIGFAGFRPTPEDTAGLSIFREKLVSPALVAASGRKPGEYYVVRLPVSYLRQLGLTVLADEQAAGPAGHALIPGLSLEACRREKVRLREVQVRLAELASHNIVHFPGEQASDIVS